MDYPIEYSADIDRWSMYDWENGGNIIINQLKQAAAKAQGRDRIILHLNSMGGDVFLGYEVANFIRTLSLTKNVVVRNGSICASIASIIAVSGISAEASKNSFLMMHKPTVWAGGDSEDLRKNADVLDKIQSQLVETYTAKIISSKKGSDYEKVKKQVQDMVDTETWLTAEEALALGLVDVIVDDKALTAEEMQKRKEEYERMQMEQQKQAELSNAVPKDAPAAPTASLSEAIKAQKEKNTANFRAYLDSKKNVPPVTKTTDEGLMVKFKNALKPFALLFGWKIEDQPAPQNSETSTQNNPAEEQPAPADEPNSQTDQNSEEEMTEEMKKEIQKAVADAIAGLNQKAADETPQDNANPQNKELEDMKKKLEEAEKAAAAAKKALEARNAAIPPAPAAEKTKEGLTDKEAARARALAQISNQTKPKA